MAVFGESRQDDLVDALFSPRTITKQTLAPSIDKCQACKLQRTLTECYAGGIYVGRVCGAKIQKILSIKDLIQTFQTTPFNIGSMRELRKALRLAH